MTFDEWMYEIEAFSSRRERLYEDLNDYQGDNIEIVDEWLEAAYNTGKSAGLQEILDLMLSDIEGDFDYILFQLKNMIKESE